MQAGSDGKTACATCHWHAGADIRTVNTLNPGAPGSTFGHQTSSGAELAQSALNNFRGPNHKMQPADYPFHRLDPDVSGISDLQGNPAEIAKVVEFLKHLTDPRVRLQQAPFDHPELILPNGHHEVDGKVLDSRYRLPANGRHGGPPLGSFEEALRSGLLIPEDSGQLIDPPV
jgi:hypothetical protein